MLIIAGRSSFMLHDLMDLTGLEVNGCLEFYDPKGELRTYNGWMNLHTLGDITIRSEGEYPSTITVPGSAVVSLRATFADGKGNSYSLFLIPGDEESIREKLESLAHQPVSARNFSTPPT